MMPPLQHANLRDLPFDLVGDYDQSMLTEWGCMMLELGDRGNRSVGNQLQHQVLLVAEAESRGHPRLRPRRKMRPRPDAPSFRRACGHLLEGERSQPAPENLSPALV